MLENKKCNDDLIFWEIVIFILLIHTYYTNIAMIMCEFLTEGVEKDQLTWN